MYKIHVIHVRVDGQADQTNIERFERLVAQFIESTGGTAILPIFTSVTPIPATSASWFTAIIQYRG